MNNTKITAKVKNIAFAKDVAIHYAQADGTWSERALSWQKNFTGYDLFSQTDNSFITTEFVIRYAVNCETFWDNNGGSNYHIDSGRSNTVGGNVILNKAIAKRGSQAGGGFVFTTSWVEGEIFVKNLSFQKHVGIRLSSNGGTSFHDTNAAFSGNVPVAVGLSQVEIWKFKTPELNLDESSADLKFAIFYNNLDTGQGFWGQQFRPGLHAQQN